MKGDPEERAVQIGRYLVQSGATVRAAAQVFGVSKSTVCVALQKNKKQIENRTEK